MAISEKGMGNYLNAFGYATIVALGGFVFGLDAAIISGTVKFITDQFQLNDLQVGTVVSAPGFGVLFALLVAGQMADRLGRKKTLITIAGIYLLSAVASSLAPGFISLVAARFLGGLAFTSLSLSSMYIGEIAPSHMRGKLVSMNQINIVVGLSAAYFINYLILQASGSGAAWVSTLGLDQHTWRWMLGSEIIPAVIWLLLLFRIPESPRWLVLNGQTDKAEEVLKNILPESEVKAEMKSIIESLNSSGEKPSVRSQMSVLFSKGMRLAFLIGLTVALVQPVTGINAIMFYAPTVFEQVGIGTNAAFVQAVYVGLTSVIFTVLSLILIDRAGRKPILVGGLIWAILSLGVCAYGFSKGTYELTEKSLSTLPESLNTTSLEKLLGTRYTSDVEFKNVLKSNLGGLLAKKYESELIQSAIQINTNLILVAILSFISAFQFSVGPVMWVLLSEIFPVSIRGIAIPFFALVTSIISYLIQQFFPWQLSIMGAAGVFSFYAILSTIGLFALLKYLPETKNKSIEEIEQILAIKSDSTSHRRYK